MIPSREGGSRLNEQPRNPLCCVALHGRGDVGVDLSSDVGAAVVEALADDLDVDAGARRQQESGRT